MSELLDAALEYAAIGWSVLPCIPNHKEPLLEDDLVKATTDPEQIKEWWSQWPNANIGIAMGDKSGGLVGIDLDEKHGHHGISTFDSWANSLYMFFGSTCSCTTPTGGKHRYYRSTKHSVQKHDGFLDGVDVRANGGYDVVPPSVINGVRYEWELDPWEFPPLSEDRDEAVEMLLDILEDFEVSPGSGKKLLEAARNEEGLIPQGMRHSYVVSVCGELVARLGDSFSAEDMLTMVESNFMANCENPHNVNMNKFRKKYLKTLKKFISRKTDEASEDWSYNRAAWLDEHPGEEFHASPEAWAEAKLAGERAKAAGKVFNQKSRNPPGGVPPDPEQGEPSEKTADGYHPPDIQCDVVTVKGEERRKVQQSISNCIEAITYDADLYGKVRYNEMSLAPYVWGQLPWMIDDHPREWTNADDAYLRLYLEKYGLTNRDKIADAFDIVAHDHPLNPVHDKLVDIHLNHWDGHTGHIRTLLPEYLGAEDSDYTFECMKLVMLAAIKRIFQPGSKFDQMMILVGPQGIGKSQFTKTLALFPEWYTDNFNSFEPDKAVAMLRGLWIVEVAELLAAKRAREIESIKAFITSTADVYREPYSRRSESRPRRCIFIGTTNDEGFLIDKTGNRRFLPIATGKVNPVKSLFADRDAVYGDFFNAWGEAMDIYLQDPEVELILPKSAADTAFQLQQRYQADDIRVGMIQRYLDDRKIDTPVCIAELYQKALGQIDKLPSRHESNELHTIMRTSITGWIRLEKRTRCGDYGPQWAYKRDDDVPGNTVPMEQLDFEMYDPAEGPF